MMKLGVSECLLGVSCRYDGVGAKDDFIANKLTEYFNFVSYCPEKVVFGTPRETIRQVEKDNEIIIETTNKKKDVTKILEESCQNMKNDASNQDLVGFILKSKSPTCGIERVKVYQEKNSLHEKKGVGLFVKELKKSMPHLPMEEEGRLQDAWLRENFLVRVYAYADFLDFLKKRTTTKDLIEFHTSYKYLIYSKSHIFYKSLGKIVANHDKKEYEDILKEYKEEFLNAIAQKGSIRKTYNVLLHIYGYFKNDISKEEKEHILTTMDEYKDGVIPLIAVTKIINLYAKKFDIEYLKKQKFLNPYPPNLALRSDIKAFK